jgi:predicted ABC-type ATPase
VPILTIIAGSNGSGKTSVIQRVKFAGRANLSEADAIASQIFAAASMRQIIDIPIFRSLYDICTKKR